MLRARRLGGVDAEGPDGEAVAVVIDDVEVGGVLEGNAVEGEVVGVVGDEDAGDLLAAAGCGPARRDPTRRRFCRGFSEPPRPSMVPSPMTPAPEMCWTEMRGLQPRPPVVEDEAALAGFGGEDVRRRGRRRGFTPLSTREGYAFAEFEGTGEECVGWGLRRRRGYGFPFAAFVEGLLDTVGVELVLVGLGDAGGGADELGLELDADGGKSGLVTLRVSEQTAARR